MQHQQHDSVSAPPTETDRFLAATATMDSSYDTTQRSSLHDEAPHQREGDADGSINEDKVLAAQAGSSSRRRKRTLITAAVLLALVCVVALIVPLAILLPKRQPAPTVVLTLKASPSSLPPTTSDADGEASTANVPPAPTAAPPVSVVVSGVNQGGYEEYRGLRYASPPTGDLRFALPQDLPGNAIQAHGGTTNDNEVEANKFGPVCPQGGDQSQQDEDCLYLNIVKPAGPHPQPLPVLFFIHGGGFESNSGSRFLPGARKLLEAGQRSGAPTAIIVTFNYRLGLLGFLGGSQMDTLRRSGTVGANLGFQDMKKALEWTSRNIADFGGDPRRITIWGQSAGAFGVGALLLASPPSINDTDITPLFTAAILQSGSPGGVPINPPRFKDPQFDRVIEQAKCQRPTPLEQIQCLRSVSWQTLRDISTGESVRARGPNAVYILGSFPWTAQIDGGPTQGGFFTSRPSVAIQNGDFAKVPLITGDVEDEGTMFAQRNFNSDAQVVDYFQTIYFANVSTNLPAALQAFDSILQAYPDDPRIGSPYSARNPNDRFFGADNRFKQVASIYGDIRFQSNRRLFTAQAVAENVPVRSYQYSEHSEGSFGVPHGSDVDMVFQDHGSSPLASVMARQWLNFAANSDPNGQGLPSWPEYGSDKRLLSYRNGGATVESDTYRQAAMDALLTDDVLALTGR